MYEPKEIIPHGGFLESGFVNDIAIINLKRPLKLNNRLIGTIALASKPPPDFESCMVAGWGTTDRDISNPRGYPFKLNEATVEIRNLQECRVDYFFHVAKVYKIKNRFYRDELIKAKDLWFYVKEEQNICAGNGTIDSCAVRALITLIMYFQNIVIWSLKG